MTILPHGRFGAVNDAACWTHARHSRDSARLPRVCGRARCIEFLTTALGFELVRRWPEDGDEVAHAELRRGDAAFTLFSDTDGYERAPRKGDTCGIGLYLAVSGPEAVDEGYASAVAAGGESVWVPERSEWNYRTRVVDPQGVEWTLGTYRPGEPDEPATS